MEINKEKVYEIYTSCDGVIEFKLKDLEPIGDNKYFFNFEFNQNYNSLTNHLCVLVNLNDMFIYIETSNGDSSEYKIFEKKEVN